jgi:hypothetical protein
VLSQEALPYAPLRPLMCFAERPGCLMGEVGSLFPRSPGKAQHSHYAEEKPGACCVLLALEPPTGARDVDGRARRTAVDDAALMPNLRHKP